MIPSTIWGIYLLSLTRLAVYDKQESSTVGSLSQFQLPPTLREDPQLAKWIQDYNLDESMPLLIEKTRRSLRGSGESLERVNALPSDLCSILSETAYKDSETRKLSLRIFGRLATFGGKAVGAAVGSLFQCLIQPPREYLMLMDDIPTVEPILSKASEIVKLPPTSIKLSRPAIGARDFGALLTPPTTEPVEDDGDVETEEEEWVDLEDPVDDESDDEDVDTEYYDVEEDGSYEDIERAQWEEFLSSRKRRRGIEPVSPADLTRVPSDFLYVASVISKLTYHSVRELSAQSSSEVRSLLRRQTPGFPIFIDSEPQYDTQVYLWLSEVDRTLYVAFRGTSSWTDVKLDLDYRIVPWDEENPSIQIHAGFRTKVRSVVDELIELTQIHEELFDKIVVTGHSLGGALATVASPILGQAHPGKELSCLTFGSPRVGNAAFVQWFHSTVDLNLRIVNDFDPIQSLPFEGYYHHVSHAISLTETGDVNKVPDAPAEKRFWNALEDLDFDRFLVDHRMDTYIVRLNSLLKKHN